MNILVINGSPKGQRSNTLRLTKAFLKGLTSALSEGACNVKQLQVHDLELQPCRGCFACWKATPGSCVIRDDMTQVIDKLLWADLVLFSFPLYYFSVPGPLKNLIDRQLPMLLPFMENRTDGVGSGSHPTRYNMSEKRWVLISTCGFYSAAGNYDSVRYMFDHICGKNGYETLFCGQGELFSVKELSSRTDEYLQLVERAGAEYAADGIAEETRQGLAQLLYPKETFEAMADASWGVSRETGEKEDESLIFTKQMAALYNKAGYDGTDRVLEICYTDLGKTYQILMGKDGSRVYEDGSL
ncbi:MAG: flavodoxin family protein, partial [Lachnospiraceae bacterium]|nr:flavodoxin family protein [Lachnospiraceae bacterium]